MAASSLAAPASVPQPSFASLGRRLAAYFLDVLIAASVILFTAFTMRGLRALVLWMPSLPQGIAPEAAWRALGPGAKSAVVFGFILLMGPIYLVLFESSAWQASLGKRLLHIYVTDQYGQRLSIVRAFSRWFYKWFLNFFGLWLVSFATIAASRRKQALHDFLASTLVVRGRPTPGGSLEPWRILAAFALPYLWQVGMFLALF